MRISLFPFSYAFSYPLSPSCPDSTPTPGSNKRQARKCICDAAWQFWLRNSMAASSPRRMSGVLPPGDLTPPRQVHFGGSVWGPGSAGITLMKGAPSPDGRNPA
jgi:hypothetical protein